MTSHIAPDAEITATWDHVLDNGEFRIEYKKSADSSWTHHATVAHTTAEATITGLLHGESYDVRVRSQTTDVKGAWQTKTIVSAIPTPAPTVEATGTDTVDLGELDPSNNTGEILIERREELDSRRDTGYGEWVEAATLDGGTQTYTDTGLDDGTSYEYRDTIRTTDTSSTSEPVEETTDFEYPEGLSIELRRGDGLKLLVEPDQILGFDQFVREPSAMSNLAVRIPEAPLGTNWHLSELYLWRTDADGSRDLHFRGEFLEQTDHQGDGETVMGGPDVVKKLERGDARRVFQNIEAWKAIDTYATEELPGWDVTVYQPNPEQIDDGLVVQTADTTAEFNEILPNDANRPAKVVGDAVHLQQVCWTTEGEDRDADDGNPNVGSDSTSSDGFHLNFPGSGGWAEWNFDVGHEIPEADVEVHLRRRLSTLSGDAIARYDVSIDGTTLVSDETPDSESWEWATHGGWTGGALEPGTHTLRVTRTGAGDESLGIDVVAPADGRFDYTLDNTVSWDGGYLDGPELYRPLDVAFEDHVQAFNVTAADITTTMDDTSNSQRLQASNDKGTTWVPSDGTETNTETVRAVFDTTTGSTIRGRVTLSDYEPGGLINSTPRTGFDGQSISSWEVAIDTNDLAVIDELELFGSHLDNWQTLHDRAGQLFVTPYQENALVMESFTPGHVDSVRQPDWIRQDATRELDLIDYGNMLTVYGGTVPDGSGGEERVTATARAEPDIEANGEIPAPPIKEERITDPDRLRNIARLELGRRLAEDAPSGTVRAAPTTTTPGYAYDVPAFGDERVTLRQVKADLDSASLRFGDLSDLSSALVNISTSMSKVKRTL